MSGKGRVKDLVDKLNSNVNYDSRKAIDYKSHPTAVAAATKSTKAYQRIQDDGGVAAKSAVVISSPHTNQPIMSPASSSPPPLKIIPEESCNQYEDKDKPPNAADNNNCLKASSVNVLYRALSEKHSSLQKAHNQLKKRLADEEEKRKRIESELKKTNPSESDADCISPPTDTKPIAEIQWLRDDKNRFLDEIQELREQNELLEFRLLELEYHNNSTKAERSALEDIGERDDISDSGVMSLSPCEDFYSETSDLLDIKLDDEEPRMTGSEVQQKLSRLFQCSEDTCDKVALQQAIDLIKHYQMRITGMEATLTNMCQERIRRYSEEFLTDLKCSDEYSKSRSPHRVIATVSPFTNASRTLEARFSESLTEKLFAAETDRLQESGIFDEFPEHDFIERKSTETQTDSAVSSRSSSTSSSSCGSGLADELNKLEKIKQRIEARSPLFSSHSKDGGDGSATVAVKKVPMVVLNKELAYFKKQYDLLKTKLAAFESSGDTKTKRLADALQKENELQNCVQFLSKRVATLEKEMKRLEEEKCEYEEAENDTRLRCQKLEVKLYALVEQKNDLQFQLQQNVRTASTLRNTICELEKNKDEAYHKAYELEMTSNELEERNFELEEREMDLRYRLQILETAFPALLLWNVYMLFCSLRQADDRPLPTQPTDSQSLVPSYCDCSTLRRRNGELKSRLCTLEREVRDKENVITKQENDLAELRLAAKVRRADSVKSRDVKQRWSELVARTQSPAPPPVYQEVYVQTLQQADEMIAGIERDFKAKLQGMHDTLTDKHWRLEECERKLASMASSRAMENHLMEKTHNLEADVSTLKQMLRTRDEEKQNLMQKEKCLAEEMEQLSNTVAQMKATEIQLKGKLDGERNLNKEWKKELDFKETEMREFEGICNNRFKQLETQIGRLTRDIESHEVTNGELTEEVKTLENAICELNLQLDEEKDEKEKMLVKFRKNLALKQQEVDSLKRLSQDMTAVSAAQEMSLVQSIEKVNMAEALSDPSYGPYSNVLPKIISSRSERNDFLKSNNKFNNSMEEFMKSKNDQSTSRIIRHKDRYTVDIRNPLMSENYPNFEVMVNTHRMPPVVHPKPTPSCMEKVEKADSFSSSGSRNETISLTIKSI